MKIIAIIPARFDSTRFPGKPLADINGKTMIQRVFEQSKKALQEVYIATDDERIETEVKSFGGMVVMTSKEHKSGTDRLAEAVDIIENQSGSSYDIVVNVQGDEPFIQPEQIQQLIDCFQDEKTDIATLIKKINDNNDLFNPNLPKVIMDKKGYALYFSRSTIPYIRNHEKAHWIEHFTFFKHIGMYAYRKHILKEISALEPSSLELAESLEQNRWIENGFRIKTKLTEYENHPVDTPDDLKQFLKKS